MIGDKIKYLRTEKRLSQEKLGKLLGVSQQAVGKWEKNDAEPDTSALKKLSEIFEVSIDYILDNTTVSSNNDNTSNVAIPNNLKDTPIAFSGKLEQLTQEDMEDVSNYIDFIIAKKKR